MMDNSSWSGGSSSDHDIFLDPYVDTKFNINNDSLTPPSADEDFYTNAGFEPLEIDQIHIPFSMEPNKDNAVRSRPVSHNGQPEFECILYHKPRGCKGIWKAVDKHAAIRVTKGEKKMYKESYSRPKPGKGKWLKLDVRSHHPFKSSDVDVFLVDISGAHNSKQIIESRLAHNADEGFTIEDTQQRDPSQTGGPHLLEIELKLDRVCKRLQFWAVFKMSDQVLIGRSVEFAAHNNGKTR